MSLPTILNTMIAYDDQPILGIYKKKNRLECY